MEILLLLLLFRQCEEVYSFRNLLNIIDFKVCLNANNAIFHFLPSFLHRQPSKKIAKEFILFYFNFYCYSITVVCLVSPSLHPIQGELTSLPHLHPPPWFCPCVLYSSSCNPLFPLSPPPPHPHALAIVRLFLTSMSLVILSLLFSSIDYVPVKGEIMWYCPSPPGLFHLA